MRTEHHLLAASTSGTKRELISLHFGDASNGHKVYIQSSLHADEVPGMLVAHYLRQTLAEFEAQGKIKGEIVLVPLANPIGLAQDIQGTAFGRFDMATGINFNRGYVHLTPLLLPLLEGKLGKAADENVRVIRQYSKELLSRSKAESETAQLKRTLQTLAIDADIVLDLHCDHQAVMHLYAGTPLTATAMPLAHYLNAKAVLVSTLSGDDPFDESCSRHWWELAEHFGADTPIPAACVAVTVELRGETEVAHGHASNDAAGIISFLQSTGHLDGTAPELPAASCEPTPLEGVEPIVAPHAGVLVFTKDLGEDVLVGESIGDVVDPITGAVTPLIATVSGVLFARVARRYAQAGMRVAKIAGPVAFRTGNLLSM